MQSFPALRCSYTGFWDVVVVIEDMKRNALYSNVCRRMPMQLYAVTTFNLRLQQVPGFSRCHQHPSATFGCVTLIVLTFGFCDILCVDVFFSDTTVERKASSSELEHFLHANFGVCSRMWPCAGGGGMHGKAASRLVKKVLHEINNGRFNQYLDVGFQEFFSYFDLIF